MACWLFDEARGTNTVESFKHTEDVIQVNPAFVSGVRDKGFKFEGFMTRTTRDSNCGRR